MRRRVSQGIVRDSRFLVPILVPIGAKRAFPDIGRQY